MSVRLFCLCAVSALAVSACATNQENPNYKYSTKYKAATPYQTASSPATVATQPASYSQSVQTAQTQPVTYVSSQAAAPVVYQPAAPVVYQSAQSSSVVTQAGYTVDQSCLKTETKRELIGGALGGTVGAIAGKKLVGGTKGTLIGAAVGGTAGYGLGDKSINCDPIPVAATPASTGYQTQTYQGQTYQAQPQPHYPASTAPAQHVQMPQVQAAPQTYQAPTDQAYGDTVGTPGYHAMMAAQGQVQPQAQPQSQPQPQAYVAPQPVYTQPQATYAPQQPAYAPPQPVYQPSQATMTQASSGQHVVVEGDTVYSMAKRLCVGVEDIQRINNLNASYNIQLGQALLLPAPRC